MSSEGLESVIVLLIAASVAAVVARRVGLSYTLALLLLGLGLGAFDRLSVPELNSETILLLFLPPLIFEAAFVFNLGLPSNRI